MEFDICRSEIRLSGLGRVSLGDEIGMMYLNDLLTEYGQVKQLTGVFSQ